VSLPEQNPEFSPHAIILVNRFPADLICPAAAGAMWPSRSSTVLSDPMKIKNPVIGQGFVDIETGELGGIIK
jgi:hypothetical protein